MEGLDYAAALEKKDARGRFAHTVAEKKKLDRERHFWAYVCCRPNLRLNHRLNHGNIFTLKRKQFTLKKLNKERLFSV